MVMLDLVSVRDDQLPELLIYLEKYLPESWSLYAKVLNQTEGRWEGTTFKALIDTEWPNILAVGEGEVDENRCKWPASICSSVQCDAVKCEGISPFIGSGVMLILGKCAEFFKTVRVITFFAPNTESAKTLLQWPGYIDWNQVALFQAISDPCVEAVKAVGVAYSKGNWFKTFLTGPGTDNLETRAIPEGMTLRKMTVDQADYIASTWPQKRPYCNTYVADLLTRFPSLGLYDSDGSVVGFELINEYGTLGFLYIEKKYRRKGYAKIITSHMLQKCKNENRRILAYVLKNTPAERLHTGLGFKPLCNANWYTHPGVGGRYTEDQLKKMKAEHRFV